MAQTGVSTDNRGRPPGNLGGLFGSEREDELTGTEEDRMVSVRRAVSMLRFNAKARRRGGRRGRTWCVWFALD